MWIWRRRWKCEKFTAVTTTMTTDNVKFSIRKAHWAKNLTASFEQIWISVSHETFVPNLDETDQVVLEIIFLKFVNLLTLSYCYHPLEKGVALHLNRGECQFPEDALCKTMIKRMLIFLNILLQMFSSILIYSKLCIFINWDNGYEDR